MRKAVLSSPGFLWRETGVRSGCVAGPATEPLPCSLSRGSKAHGAERSVSRGPGVEDSQHRGRCTPEEDRVRRNRKLPVPVGRGGAKAPSRASDSPSYRAPRGLEKTPTSPKLEIPQSCSNSDCAPLEERSRKSEKCYM